MVQLESDVDGRFLYVGRVRPILHLEGEVGDLLGECDPWDGNNPKHDQKKNQSVSDNSNKFNQSNMIDTFKHLHQGTTRHTT